MTLIEGQNEASALRAEAAFSEIIQEHRRFRDFLEESIKDLAEKYGISKESIESEVPWDLDPNLDLS